MQETSNLSMQALRDQVVNGIKKNTITSDRFQIAKGEYHLPYLYLVYVKEFDKYYTLQSELKDISEIELHDVKVKYIDNGVYHQIDKRVYDVLTEAISKRKQRKHLDNFSFINGYCLGKGIDLQVLGVF